MILLRHKRSFCRTVQCSGGDLWKCEFEGFLRRQMYTLQNLSHTTLASTAGVDHVYQDCAYGERLVRYACGFADQSWHDSLSLLLGLWCFLRLRFCDKPRAVSSSHQFAASFGWLTSLLSLASALTFWAPPGLLKARLSFQFQLRRCLHLL